VVDAKGRVTSISNAAINVNTALGYTPLGTTAAFANTASQDVQIGGTYAALTATLATSGVTAGGYGNTTSIPTITVDAKGRVTSVSNNTISTTPNATYVQNTDSRTLSGNLIFSSTLEANTTNAAIIISGGVLLSKSLYANATTAAAYFNNVVTSGVTVGSYVDSISIATGSLIANGGVGIAKNLYANATTASAYFNNVYTRGVEVTSTVDSTSILTGSVIIDGGVGIAKNLYANATTAAAYFNNVYTVAVDVTSTTDSTSILTGSIITDGGVGIAKNLYANGTGATAYFNSANVGATLFVNGAVTLANTLSTTGLTTLSANLVMGGNHITTPTLKSYREFTVNATATTSYSADLSLSNMFLVTGTNGSNCTFSFANPPAVAVSQAFTIVFKQPATGFANATWPATVRWSYGDQPVLASTVNARDVFTFMTFDNGTTYLGAHSMANVA
jgi:CTP:phosphocholine cytidylyltransferase-like protein